MPALWGQPRSASAFVCLQKLSLLLFAHSPFAHSDAFGFAWLVGAYVGIAYEGTPATATTLTFLNS